MSKKDFLFEIGTEEIPAGFIPRALNELKRRLESAFDKGRLSFDAIETLGTPRRLTLIVRGLAEMQPDITIEVRGPKVEAAFDADGKPTKALTGFMRGQGVEIEAITKVESKKGSHIVAKKLVIGGETVKFLPEILTKAVSHDLFPKAMRWGAGKTAFGRPVHWIVALFGTDLVDFEFANIKSGRKTLGHRFLSSGTIEVNGPEDYIDALKAASVIVDPIERRTIIVDGLHKGADEVQGKLLSDDELVEEVVNLVEFPVVLRGSIEPEFLKLPREVIINAMRSHQRYFSVIDDNGELLPYFMTVANIAAKDPAVVVKGNERVLRARLNDANFYFNQDKKTTLDEWLEGLKGVVFQAKLGTSFAKVERFTALAEKIGSIVGHKDSATLRRASMLAKADLVTGMVMEFPKLQGLMGSVYATLGGESAEVSTAIREHYMPVAAGAELPESLTGSIVSIADKMDTIAGCFGVGLIPTGSQDPYALRRAAVGIISIIVDKGLNLSLDTLIAAGVDGIGVKLTRDADEVKGDICAFFAERLKNQLLGTGLSFDAIDAVLSTSWFSLGDAVARIRALEAFKSDPDCSRLVIAFKRVSNILKGVELSDKAPDPSLFTDVHETALFDISKEIAPKMESAMGSADYELVFTTLTSIKDAVDSFFDEVMVMAEDAAVRENRLRLLGSVRALYATVADLSRLTVVE